MLNEKRDAFSKKFYFLSGATGKKEKINQFKSNANFYIVEIFYEDFNKFSPDCYQFDPAYLKTPEEKKKVAREIVVEALKQLVSTSNSDIVGNADYLILKWILNLRLNGL